MADLTFNPGFRQRSDCAVIVACDANYLPYASVLARQLAPLAGAGFDILIGGPDPETLPGGLIAAGIGHVAARDPVLEARLPLDARRSVATYMDVFLARALRGIYRRILVLDADILHDRGDPAGLFAAGMHGHAVAAVRDHQQWRRPNRRSGDQKKLGWAAAPYFNAGVVMFDLAAWAEADMPARCAEFAATRLAGVGRDQALLNGVLHGDWAEMSPMWNWQYTWASSYLTQMADPCLIHFIGPKKPWRPDARGVVPMRWRMAYDGLHHMFPDAGGIAPDLDVRAFPPAGEIRRALWRQFRAAGPMAAYLARFPDIYTILPGQPQPAA
ncbi:glycosyltransferase family 8 protein [Paracoccus pacificus]|uniref:Glycosyltransferase family 8 protein n=1 Tax=Paracoccus pacificus TaxID=1463598 RepID=A0ABW4RAP9_9RHOB